MVKVNSEMTEEEKSNAREVALTLMKEKDTIEKTIAELKGILDSNGVGLTGSLIDSEGYPRQDIDVYQVRHARHRIICLQNDYKALMAKIEKQLHVVLAPDSNTVQTEDTSTRQTNVVPFAVVGSVEGSSPAEEAGLVNGDEIIQFGSVTGSNFNNLMDVGRVVQHSEGRSVDVVVLRGSNRLRQRMHLKPRKWQGPGLLGCTLLPYSTPER